MKFKFFILLVLFVLMGSSSYASLSNEDKFLKAISYYIHGNEQDLKKAHLLVKELLKAKNPLSDYYSLMAKIKLARFNINNGNALAPESESKIALDYAWKAFQKDKKNYSALSALADLYLYRGKYKSARKYAKMALKYFPGDTESLLIISMSYSGKMEDFLNPSTKRGYYFSKLLKLEGVSPYTLSDIGKIYLENGQYTKAHHFFRLANKQFKKRVESAFFAALSLWNMGKRNKAITIWQKCLKYPGENNYKSKIKNLLKVAGIKIK